MSVVVIKGVPQSGKTSFLGTIMEFLHAKGVIQEFASNANFIGVDWVRKIDNAQALKQWGYSNNKSKFFGYDELIESTTNRRAMSDINVWWVQNLPQISHMKMHVCAIVQEEQGGKRYYESVFLDPVYLRGIWYKEKRDIAVFKSFFYKEWADGYRLRGIPRTGLKFERDMPAHFGLVNTAGMNDLSMMPRTIQVGFLYQRDEIGYKEVMKATGITEKKIVQREIKKCLREFFKSEQGRKALELNGDVLPVIQEQPQTAAAIVG